MKEFVNEKWKNFLNPDILKTNLILGSLYITVYGLLKESIIERIKNIYIDIFDKNGLNINEDYSKEILSRNKSPLYASLDWLKENGIIDDNDCKIFEEIKLCRNELSHEMKTLFTNEIKTNPIINFINMIDLLNKIEKWWIVNVDLPINSDICDEQINEDDVIPGIIMSIQLMIKIALGDDKESRYFYDIFNKSK
jgi:hypothetical protein